LHNSSPAPESTLFLTGGVDKEALLIDKSTGAIMGKLVAHSKRVTSVTFHPNYPQESVVLTASADKTIKVKGKTYFHNRGAWKIYCVSSCPTPKS